MSNLKELEKAVAEGKEKEAVDIANDLSIAGADVHDLREAIRDGVRKSSENWSAGKHSAAEVLVSIDAFRAVKDLLTESAKPEGIKPIGRVIIGTIAGNVHQIGKALTAVLLEGEGFEVFDLGENVPRRTFITKISETNPDILVLACYTFAAQNEVKGLLQEIDKSGLRSNLKVIIGGHSTSHDFADRIGADAWAANLLDAAVKARNFANLKRKG